MLFYDGLAFLAFILCVTLVPQPSASQLLCCLTLPNTAMVFAGVNSAITPGHFQSPCGQVQFHLFLTCVSYFRDCSALLYISVKLCFIKTL